MFIEVPLFSETFPALKNSWLSVCCRRRLNTYAHWFYAHEYIYIYIHIYVHIQIDTHDYIII